MTIDDVIELLESDKSNDWTEEIAAIREAIKPPPAARLIAVIEGGILQAIYTDATVDAYVIDRDTDSSDDDEPGIVTLSDGERIYVAAGETRPLAEIGPETQAAIDKLAPDWEDEGDKEWTRRQEAR